MRLSTLRAAIEAVQNGAVEFHSWGVSFPNLDKPDRLILDLDPDADVTWARFREAADHVRALLDDLELAWFIKTTGGKGLHFVMPLTRRHDWSEVKGFAEALARRLTGSIRTFSSPPRARRSARAWSSSMAAQHGWRDRGGRAMRCAHAPTCRCPCRSTGCELAQDVARRALQLAQRAGHPRGRRTDLGRRTKRRASGSRRRSARRSRTDLSRRRLTARDPPHYSGRR
jgi:hypothetical protein